jgi:hypothetical protein
MEHLLENALHNGYQNIECTLSTEKKSELKDIIKRVLPSAITVNKTTCAT